MSANDNKLIWESFFNRQKDSVNINYKEHCFSDLEYIKDLIEEIDKLDSYELKHLHKDLSQFSDKIKKYIETSLRPDVEFRREEEMKKSSDEF